MVERNDGYIIGGSNSQYFAQYKDWPLYEKQAIKYVKGKVLDIGCGAGKHSIYLQRKGFEVLAIDKSPLAIRTCKKRGVKKTEVLSIELMKKN